MVEARAQGSEIFLQWQSAFNLSRLDVIEQQFALAGVRHRADETRVSRIANEGNDAWTLVLDLPDGFAVARVVQLDGAIVVAMDEIALVLRDPVKRCHRLVRVRRRGSERSYSPGMELRKNEEAIDRLIKYKSVFCKACFRILLQVMCVLLKKNL